MDHSEHIQKCCQLHMQLCPVHIGSCRPSYWCRRPSHHLRGNAWNNYT